MTILHIVAISLILAGIALSSASVFGAVPFSSGPYLFAAGTILEFAGWLVAIWTDDKKDAAQ